MKPPTLTIAAEPFHLLELNIISAQDLQPVSRSMSTYAAAWIQPHRKLCTRVDSGNHTDPQWNDKFVFRVGEWFLRNETSAVMVEIYCVGWLRDTLVGTVRVLIGNLFPEKGGAGAGAFGGMQFTALQIRRPSGRPQGILNLGATVLDSSLRSMPLYAQLNPAIGYRDLMGKNIRHIRRTKSVSEVRSVVMKGIDESVDESEVTVAEKASPAEFFPSEVGSSVLEDWSVASAGGKEELGEKLEKWRSEFPPVLDRGSGRFSSLLGHQATERRTTSDVEGAAQEVGDSGERQTSCFGDKYTAGCECSVSCGLKPRKKSSGAVGSRPG